MPESTPNTMPSLDPVILFFLFGLVAGLLRSELKLPSALYESLTIFLLLAIGLKGGQGLATQALGSLVPQLVAVIVLGSLQTLIAFVFLRSAFGFDRQNAASTAAHYGSVSVATFAVAASWFASRNIEVEPQMAALLAVMEIPAILVGIVLATAASLGLAQVNRHNLARQGLDSYEKAFAVCPNLQAGSRILASGW